MDEEFARKVTLIYARARSAGAKLSRDMTLGLTFSIHLGLFITMVSWPFCSSLGRILASFSYYSPYTLKQIQYVLLFSRQGKVRLQKWYQATALKEKKKIQRELVQTILSRRSKMCNILEYKDLKVVYKR